jgi:hypothetical protein
MSNSLFEPREFSFIHRKFVDEHIEISSLVAKIHPQTEGVVDNNESKNESQGENSRIHSLEIGNGSECGSNKGGVGAGHMAVRKKISPFPAVFQRIKKKLQGLGEESDSDGNNNDDVVFPVHIHILPKRRFFRK